MLYKCVLQTVLGMGMGMRVTAHHLLVGVDLVAGDVPDNVLDLLVVFV